MENLALFFGEGELPQANCDKDQNKNGATVPRFLDKYRC